MLSRVSWSPSLNHPVKVETRSSSQEQRFQLRRAILSYVSVCAHLSGFGDGYKPAELIGMQGV